MRNAECSNVIITVADVHLDSYIKFGSQKALHGQPGRQAVNHCTSKPLPGIAGG